MAKRKRSRRRVQPAPPATGCQTGCGKLALERHDTASGPAWICGACGMRARLAARNAALEQLIAEALSEPLERWAEFRHRWRQNRGMA